MERHLAGALAGWRRTSSEHGIVLRLQLVDSVDNYRARAFETVEIALNDRQLRSLTRDLMRAAGARGLELSARRPWWKPAWKSR